MKIKNQKISKNINNEKTFENSNDKIFENSNEKILNVESNNEKLLKSEEKKVDNFETDKKDPDDINENQRNSSIHSYEENEVNIKKVYLIFMLQIILIGVFSWLGCYNRLEKIFNASTSTMLWTFIPTLIFIFIVTIIYVIVYGDDEDCSCFVIFNILFVPLMTFYCFLLTDYTTIGFILIQLFIILLDVLIMLLNAIIFKYSKGYWQNFIFPLIANAIVIPLACLFFKISKISEIVNISIISFSCIIYLIIIYAIIRGEDKSVIMALMAFNYGIFAPGAFITAGILYLVFSLIALGCECFCGNYCDC